MTELKIEPGKWYRTRNGDKQYCVGFTPEGKAVFCFDGGVVFATRHLDGRVYAAGTGTHRADIVAEWQEPLSEDAELLVEWVRDKGPWFCADDATRLLANPRKCIEEMREARDA